MSIQVTSSLCKYLMKHCVQGVSLIPPERVRCGREIFTFYYVKRQYMENESHVLKILISIKFPVYSFKVICVSGIMVTVNTVYGRVGYKVSDSRHSVSPYTLSFPLTYFSLICTYLVLSFFKFLNECVRQSIVQQKIIKTFTNFPKLPFEIKSFSFPYNMKVFSSNFLRVIKLERPISIHILPELWFKRRVETEAEEQIPLVL